MSSVHFFVNIFIALAFIAGAYFVWVCAHANPPIYHLVISFTLGIASSGVLRACQSTSGKTNALLQELENALDGWYRTERALAAVRQRLSYLEAAFSDEAARADREEARANSAHSGALRLRRAHADCSWTIWKLDIACKEEMGRTAAEKLRADKADARISELETELEAARTQEETRADEAAAEVAKLRLDLEAARQSNLELKIECDTQKARVDRLDTKVAELVLDLEAADTDAWICRDVDAPAATSTVRHIEPKDNKGKSPQSSVEGQDSGTPSSPGSSSENNCASERALKPRMDAPPGKRAIRPLNFCSGKEKSPQPSSSSYDSRAVQNTGLFSQTDCIDKGDLDVEMSDHSCDYSLGFGKLSNSLYGNGIAPPHDIGPHAGRTTWFVEPSRPANFGSEMAPHRGVGLHASGAACGVELSLRAYAGNGTATHSRMDDDESYAKNKRYRSA